MDIHFYDYDFNELAYTDRVISANWKLCFNEVGTGEYHFDINNPILKVLLKNKYLFTHQDNAEYELFGVVVGVTFGDDIAVFCRTLNWFLTKMLSPPVTGAEETTAGVKVKEIFDGSVGCSIAAGDFLPEFGEKFYFCKDGYGALFGYISECLANVNAGHEIRPDIEEKQLYFDILPPNESHLFISVNDGSASKIEVAWDILDFYNAGFYEKANEADDTTEWTELPPENGTAKAAQWYTMLEGVNYAEAQTDLLKKSVNNLTTATVQRLDYQSDYLLGDIVTVQIENENDIITVNQQITSVQLNWDETGLSQQPVLTDLNEFKKGEPSETEGEETI